MITETLLKLTWLMLMHLTQMKQVDREFRILFSRVKETHQLKTSLSKMTSIKTELHLISNVMSPPTRPILSKTNQSTYYHKKGAQYQFTETKRYPKIVTVPYWKNNILIHFWRKRGLKQPNNQVTLRKFLRHTII